MISDQMDRTSGKGAHRTNIAAVYELAESIRSTLGPRGMDKMIVDGLGDITVTNDGYTLLSAMRVQHPAAKLAIEAAVAQQTKVGDGTTTVIVLAGELLRKAQELLDQNIHPAVIARGFRLSEKYAQEMLRELGQAVGHDQEDIIIAVAQTAMTGKGAESAREFLARIALQAVRNVLTVTNKVAVVDSSALRLERMVASSVDETELVNGVVLTREKAHPQMPGSVRNAKIALIDRPIEIKDPEITTQIHINDPAQMQAFVDQEQQTLQALVEHIRSSGCNVLFCQQNIEEPADFFLSKGGVLAFRRVPQSDLVRISKATGAKIVSSPALLEESDLGRAGEVREVVRDQSSMVYIEKCEHPKAVTILVKGGTEHAAEEATRALDDAIGDIVSVLTQYQVVGGGGAIEVQLARRLRERARATLGGKERLILEAFADALLIIPRTLIESSGRDPIDVIAEIERRQEAGSHWAGFNAVKGEVADSWNEGIVEPLQIKTQAVGSATDVAALILRIDDIFIGDRKESGMPSAGL
jgi:archaeal chaperonin